MKDKIQVIKNSRRGLGLPLAVVIVVVLAVLGIGFIQLGLNARLQAVRDVAVVSARTAADAGIEHAVRYTIKAWNTSDSKSTFLSAWNDATVWTNPAVPATAVKYSFGPIKMGGAFGDAEFQYSIYKGTLQTGYQIISTGTAAGQTRTVHAAAVLKSAFFGVGAKEYITVMPGVKLSTIPDDESFIIQTNSIKDDAITLKPNVIVPGDVVVGPGGDVDTAIDSAKSTVIEGQTRAAEDYIDFPPVPIPDTTVCPPGSMTLVGADYYIYGNTRLSNINLGSNVILYIGNPSGGSGTIKVYVAGPTNLAPDSKIIVNKGYSLELYLGGNMYAAPQSEISYDYDLVPGPPYTLPQDTDVNGVIETGLSVSILGTSDMSTDPATPLCTSILLQPKDDFYGTIYAPDASLTLKPNGNFYGAVVGGNTIDMYPGEGFVFIPALFDWADVEELYMGIKHGSWWE